MDIGLEKLIEMIEQRLGKLAGNILLGLIVLAVIGVSVHLIWQYLLSPSWQGIVVVYTWIAAHLSGAPISQPRLHLTFLGVLRVLPLIVGGACAAYVLFTLGVVVRLVIEDHRIARDVRRNPPWSDERASDAFEKAWRRSN